MHFVEFEQGGAARAEYGARLLPRLAEKLTEEFGRGFDASNLHKMKQFYLTFPILDALRLKLSWPHYRALLRVEDAQAREWHVKEAVAQNWSSRALERQVGRRRAMWLSMTHAKDHSQNPAATLTPGSQISPAALSHPWSDSLSPASILNHSVVSRPAVQHIDAGAAAENIIAGATQDDVVTGTAGEDIVVAAAVGGESDEARG